MSTSWRAGAVLLGVVLVTAGCDKSGTTPLAGKPGDETYAKKLVGTWEGSEDGPKGKETVTVEFKADGAMKFIMGPFDMTGTYKVTKEEGKTVTIDSEMTLGGLEGVKDAPKPDKKTFTVTFEDANTMVMSPTDKKDPKTFKRKS